MADNFVANAGSGGSTFAADDISSVLYPRVKVTWGADGTANDANATTPMPVELVPSTTGGLSTYSLIGTGSSGDATNVKASAGKLYGITCFNINAAVRYIKFYNSASAPTAGSGTPVLRFAIPGSTTGGGFTMSFPNGIAFSSGIGFTIVTGIADNSSANASASETLVNLLYK